jgi:hypothetical protein
MTGRTQTKETKIKISERLTAKHNKDQNRYRAYLGHVLYIYKAIKGYADDWNLKISSQEEFKQWSLYQTTEYDILYEAWKSSNWDKLNSPVVMRHIKKNGFVISNLYWSIKGQHDWWNGKLDENLEQNKTMEVRQIEKNKSTPEEQEEMIDRLKAKRKNK